jgi:ferredoxin-NADP reductase
MEISFLRKLQNAAAIWSVFFDKPAGLRFQPGDYAELALAGAGPHGDKRWMSLASAPQEPEIQFTFKVSDRPSAYKKALLGLQPGDKGMISPPMGSFNLPRDAITKLLFIAGGIGITPYRSMLKSIQLNGDHRDVVLIYVANPAEFIFGDILEAAHVPIIQTSESIDFNWLKKRVADIAERVCYFAGPQPFCEKLYAQAQAAGLPNAQLRLDYFEGYNEL